MHSQRTASDNGTDSDGASRNWLPDRLRSLLSRKKKQVDVESGESDDKSDSGSESSSSDSEDSLDGEKLFDPSEILTKGVNVPTKITKYIEKYAYQGITK